MATGVVCAGIAAPAHAAHNDSTLVVGLLSEPATLNPLAVSSAEALDIIDRMFLKLAEEQGDLLHFNPRLASAWHASADGLSITFVLRDDVRWSDGEPVTARDVRFSWSVQRDTLVAWPEADKKQSITGVDVLDDRHVVFHFDHRYPRQFKDANLGVILPRHILGELPRASLRNASFGRHPVGCGPYELESWKPGQSIVLRARPDYYEGPPRVTRVEFRVVPDMVALAARLKTGEVDVLESVPVDRARELKKQPGIRLYAYPSRRMAFIAWNLKRPLFADPAVRRALAMAVNRDELIQTLWGGYAKPFQSAIHPLLWAHDPHIQPIVYSPARAREALGSARWTDPDGDGVVESPNGTRFEFTLIVNNNPLRIDAATLVQSYLRRVGVVVHVRVLEFNTYIKRILSGNYDAAYVNWKSGTKADLKSMWHSGSVPPGGYNFTRYRNASVDRWIEQARAATSPDSARAPWFRAQEAIYKDQPALFLAVPQDVVALSSRFCNVHPNAISFFANLRDWKIVPDCDSAR